MRPSLRTAVKLSTAAATRTSRASLGLEVASEATVVCSTALADLLLVGLVIGRATHDERAAIRRSM